MICFSRNKKGNIGADVVLITVLLFILAIGGIFAYMILKDFNTDIQSSFTDATAKAEHDAWTGKFPAWLDGAFAFLFGLAWVGMLVGSFLIDTRPVFFVIALVLLVFVFIVGAFLSNFYADFVESDGITVESNFPIMNFIMGHLLQVTIAVAFSTGIALFAKFRSSA